MPKTEHGLRTIASALRCSEVKRSESRLGRLVLKADEADEPICNAVACRQFEDAL